MTATEILRRMLDERGVEWHGDEATYWGDFDAVESVFYDNALEVALYGVSPQQAIDATLGRGTCKNVGYYIDSTRFKCSACGYNGWTKYAADGKDRVPRYCPNCGAEVVDDAQDDG